MPNFNSLIIVLVAAAVYTAATCIEIEVLNRKAGYYLPHNNVNEPNSKWRRAPANEQFWKSHRNNKDGTIDESPLSDSGLVQMKRDIQREQNENRLHELIETRGLLQYPIGIGVVIACAWFWNKARTKRHLMLMFASSVCSIIALVFAFYRGYMTSLGW